MILLLINIRYKVYQGLEISRILKTNLFIKLRWMFIVYFNVHFFYAFLFENFHLQDYLCSVSHYALLSTHPVWSVKCPFIPKRDFMF